MLLDERVNTNFDKLNDNDLHIAHFVNTHIEQCKTLKIQELSQYTHASNATIHRFTRKLGFDGYSDFKSYLNLKVNLYMKCLLIQSNNLNKKLKQHLLT